MDLEVVVAADQHRLRRWDPRRNVKRVGPVGPAIQHHRWYSHRWQDVAQVGLLEGTVEGIRHRWACTNAEVVCEPAPLLVARKQARTPVAHDLVGHRVASPAIAEIGERGDAIWLFEPVAVCPGMEQRQRSGSLRVGCCVQGGHATTFVGGKDHRPGRPCCVQHGVQILHPSLRGGELAAVVGQAGATLVEQNQPEAGGQLEVEITPPRIFPPIDEVRHVVGHVDQVGVSRTHDLVGDRDSATPRISKLRRRHARHCLQEQSRGQPADMRATVCRPPQAGRASTNTTSPSQPTGTRGSTTCVTCCAARPAAPWLDASRPAM